MIVNGSVFQIWDNVLKKYVELEPVPEDVKIIEEKKKGWSFDLFEIKCTKCGSFKTEFEGKMRSEGGWYGSHSLEGHLLVKCHDCGNAMTIESGDIEGDER